MATVPLCTTKRRKKAEINEFVLSLFPELLETERLEKCKEQCGACLLDICGDDQEHDDNCIENNGNNLNKSETIGLLEQCIHSFHAACIQKWSQRDTSCPQCKSRFSYIGFYSLDGRRQRLTYATQVFFGDTLTDSEDEDESPEIDDSEVFEWNQRDESNNRRRGSTRSRGRRRGTREASSQSSCSAMSTEARGRRLAVSKAQPPVRRHKRTRQSGDDCRTEIERDPAALILKQAEDTLRRQLRRDVEMERRRRKCRISEEQAKKSIEMWFTRLPYHSNEDINISHKSINQSQQGSKNKIDASAINENQASNAVMALTNLSQKVQDQEEAKKTNLNLQTKTRLPVAVRVKSKPPSSFALFGFENFASQAPKYATDFLLQSSTNEANI